MLEKELLSVAKTAGKAIITNGIKQGLEYIINTPSLNYGITQLSAGLSCVGARTLAAFSNFTGNESLDTIIAGGIGWLAYTTVFFTTRKAISRWNNRQIINTYKNEQLIGYTKMPLDLALQGLLACFLPKSMAVNVSFITSPIFAGVSNKVNVDYQGNLGLAVRTAYSSLKTLSSRVKDGISDRFYS